MGKSTKREMLNAAGVGLAVGLLSVLATFIYTGLRAQTAPSVTEEAIMIVAFHELWLLYEFFNVDLKPGEAMVVHVAYNIILAMVITALYRHFRPLRLTNPNACLSCHYDLTGNESGTCPECGTAITASSKTEVAG